MDCLSEMETTGNSVKTILLIGFIRMASDTNSL